MAALTVGRLDPLRVELREGQSVESMAGSMDIRQAVE